MANSATKKLCPYHDGKYCGYSQEVVDALMKEWDMLVAENKQLNQLLKRVIRARKLLLPTKGHLIVAEYRKEVDMLYKMFKEIAEVLQGES